jgi:hypothetical protein
MHGVRLRPGVAFALTSVPVYKLADRRVRLAAMLPEDAPRLEKRLADMQTPDERFDALEQFLVPRMVGAQIDFRVQSALSRESKIAVGRFESRNSLASVGLVLAI